jgi:hypothetical protein
MFSVNVLLYGNHPNLAARCLTTLIKALTPKHVVDVRIGLNDVSEATADLARVFAEGVTRLDMQCLLFREKANRNVMKYPLMRRMLAHKTFHSDRIDKVMWFDDDSYVTARTPQVWFDAVDKIFAVTGATMMGSLYRPKYHWTAREMETIAKQPWCTDYALLKSKPLFATGGWWVAALEFLRKWDYPFPEVRHNGGDVLLGELCRQQGVRLEQFREGVAINADASGKESAAPRRGVTTPRVFEGPPPYDLSHHDFDVEVTSFGNWWGDNYVDV